MSTIALERDSNLPIRSLSDQEPTLLLDEANLDLDSISQSYRMR